MLADLNEDGIDNLLSNELLGRIGCSAYGITYIVPVHYAYEEPFIYAQSAEGLKVRFMRQNPEVCFEVDHLENFFNWRSAICWGTFEEITGDSEKQLAMQKIAARIAPYLHMHDAHAAHGITERAADVGATAPLVVYRIRLRKKSGKFEQRDLLTINEQEM